MKKILAVTYGGGHVNIIRALYKEMQKSSDIEFVILALTMAAKVLDHEQIPHLTISEVACQLDSYEKILEYGKKAADENHNPDSGIKYEDAVAYFGIGYLDLVKQYGAKQAAVLFEKEGRKAFLPVESMKEILQLIKPDALLITTSPRMEKAAGIAGSQMNIPVVKVADLPIVSRVDYPCKLCVMNEWSKDYVVNQEHMVAENVVVTGQPVFEENLVVDKDIEDGYRKNLKRNYDKVITYLGQPQNPDTEMTIQILLEYARNNPNQMIIIRPHPNDDSIDCLNSENVLVTKKGELKYIIAISDLLITHYSTAGLEGALMGKPLVTVLVNSVNEVRYSQLGIAVEVNSFQDLKPAIYSCLQNFKIQEQLRNGLECFKNKEHAAHNIIKVILQVMK